METSGFTIDWSKLQQIQALVMAEADDLTITQIDEFILADWPEGSEHQLWLDSATASEIASWVISGLANADRG